VEIGGYALQTEAIRESSLMDRLKANGIESNAGVVND